MIEWNKIILKLMIIEVYGKNAIYRKRAKDLIKAIETFLKKGE